MAIQLLGLTDDDKAFVPFSSRQSLQVTLLPPA